ncbi:hypothetical protein FBQ97_16505 [Acidobacteria bacterium ACD]|nr:MAG: hypothetical protein EDX89_18685 [Acidobacteriota bacterium]MCE7959609.1 hypothetical protein [Acidobacteria bacterium ACB2]MDL1951396.1 hypothetical protein [Acidobacteria bacterium ACD]
MEVQLGLRKAPELPEERPVREGEAHGGGSYGLYQTLPTRVSGLYALGVPRERLWTRAAAFGIDLVLLAGGPLLLAAVVVFGILLADPDPPRRLSLGFRAAQVVFVLLFLARDAGPGSPGKRLLGLAVVGPHGASWSLGASVLRNLPLLLPLWNLVEAIEVVRRGDGRRPGDRVAGTRVVER